MSLQQLPPELLGEQLRHLPFRDINRFCKTNRYLAQQCRKQPLNRIVQQKREEYIDEINEEIIDILIRSLNAGHILNLSVGDLTKIKIPGQQEDYRLFQADSDESVTHKEAFDYIEQAVEDQKPIRIQIYTALPQLRKINLEEKLAALPGTEVNRQNPNWHYIKLDLAELFDTWYEEGLE